MSVRRLLAARHARPSLDFRTRPVIDVDDLVDSTEVADLLGLGNPTSVSVYQTRYPDMPRSVVHRRSGRCQEVAPARSSRRSSKQSPATNASTAPLANCSPRATRPTQRFISKATATRPGAPNLSSSPPGP